MEVAEWTEELTTGLQSQDYQHKEFIQLINHLCDQFVKESGRSFISHALSYLREYAEKHFCVEEEYMRKSHYPEIKAHIEEHQAFHKFLSEIAHSSDKTPMMSSALLCNKLNHWFISHIKQVDLKLGAWLDQHPEFGQ